MTAVAISTISIICHVRKAQRDSVSLQIPASLLQLSLTLHFKIQTLTKLLMTQLAFKGMWCHPTKSVLTQGSLCLGLVAMNLEFLPT